MEDTYADFVEKFKPKLTTDDCYTPPLVYGAVASWVCKEYRVDKEKFVRPFYPGGDFENYNYKTDDIVVDNPPFSILSRIVNFFCDKNIKFFIFAHGLTLLGSARKGVRCCYIGVGIQLTYDNGAKINTSFITNLESPGIRTAPDLYRLVDELQPKKSLPKYEYPPEVITATHLNYMSKYGVNFKVDRAELHWITGLDAQRDHKKAIYGSGFLSSKPRPPIPPTPDEPKQYWELSDNERRIIWKLS